MKVLKVNYECVTKTKGAKDFVLTSYIFLDDKYKIVKKFNFGNELLDKKMQVVFINNSIPATLYIKKQLKGWDKNWFEWSGYWLDGHQIRNEKLEHMRIRLILDDSFSANCFHYLPLRLTSVISGSKASGYWKTIRILESDYELVNDSYKETFHNAKMSGWPQDGEKLKFDKFFAEMIANDPDISTIISEQEIANSTLTKVLDKLNRKLKINPRIILFQEFENELIDRGIELINVDQFLEVRKEYYQNKIVGSSEE